MTRAEAWAVALENKGLVYLVLNRYVNSLPFEKREDARDHLESIAWIAMLNATERFDPERGYQFSTYAGKAITQELAKHLRSLIAQTGGSKNRTEAPLGYNQSLDGLMAHRDREEAPPPTPEPLIEEDFAEALVERLDRDAVMVKLNQILDDMPGLEGEATRLRYRSDPKLSYQAIAEKVGFSWEWVRQAILEGEEYLKWRMQALGVQV